MGSAQDRRLKAGERAKVWRVQSWVIQEIKKKVNGFFASPPGPTLGSAFHGVTMNVPLEREPATPNKIPFSSTSEMAPVITPVPRHPIIT